MTDKNLFDYTEEFDTGWSSLLDEVRRKGEPALNVFIPWGPHESIRGVKDFSKSPRLRLERFLGMTHERSLKLNIVVGFPAGSFNSFPQWAHLESEKTLIPYSSWEPSATGMLLTEIPSLDNVDIRHAFKEFTSDVASVLSLYRSPEGPVESMKIDFGLYETSLNIHLNPSYTAHLSERYGDIQALNLLYGTYFREFGSLSSDGALRSLIAKRPWLFAFDYHWCRNRILLSALSEILQQQSMVPMLSLIDSAEPTPNASSHRILFDATMLNGSNAFIPGGISHPSYSLCYEIYLSLRANNPNAANLVLLNEQSNDEVFQSEEITLVCSKFLQKKHWARLLEVAKLGTKLNFPLEVPHYDEFMERYELKGGRSLNDLRSLVTTGQGNIRPFLDGFPTKFSARLHETSL